MTVNILTLVINCHSVVLVLMVQITKKLLMEELDIHILLVYEILTPTLPKGTKISKNINSKSRLPLPGLSYFQILRCPRRESRRPLLRSNVRLSGEGSRLIHFLSLLLPAGTQ